MTEPYALTFDADRKLLCCELHGFWDEVILEAYVRDLSALAREQARRGIATEQILALTDARGLSVQSQQLVEHFDAMSTVHAPKFARDAILIESALFRRQAARVSRDNQRLFSSEAEALAWLMDDSGAKRSGSA